MRNNRFARNKLKFLFACRGRGRQRLLILRYVRQKYHSCCTKDEAIQLVRILHRIPLLLPRTDAEQVSCIATVVDDRYFCKLTCTEITRWIISIMSCNVHSFRNLLMTTSWVVFVKQIDSPVMTSYMAHLRMLVPFN